MPRRPKAEAHTVRQYPWGGVDRWEPGSWDAHVGKIAFLRAGAPWGTGRCLSVTYAPDGSYVDLTYGPDPEGTS